MFLKGSFFEQYNEKYAPTFRLPVVLSHLYENRGSSKGGYEISSSFRTILKK
jgi:hypothetical protein